MNTVLDRPTISPKTAEAIDLIQHHLDKEARNRRQNTLSPKDLCPMQKSDLVADLARALGE